MTSSDSTKVETRLHVESPLDGGTAVGLDPGRAHFLRSVLRLQPGAVVALFNARDGEWLARIDALGKGWCSLEVLSQRRVPGPEPDLWLAFAPIKRARLDFLVEKATELGVSALHPVMTRRTNVERVNLERLRANAREAAEQCERLSLPEVAEPVKLDALLATWPAERRLLLCCEAGPAPALAEVLAEFRAAGAPARPAPPWGVMCGPEGGFAESELDALRKLPFVYPASLGPRILRADTAALAALACWQAWLGDWTLRPPGRG
ncbi:MAG TPA: 16S rRNA (uracil(1498)-N(3))-methyltransferase [Kiloniellaceae bacterium]|nr:16S rRNA (uracil(1498)-N(3))-methyltransferase [Kiloniellaceae bacterium]